MKTSLNITMQPIFPTDQIASSKLRKISLLAGLLYVLTFISIPTLSLYQPIHQVNYISTTNGNNNVIVGGLLEIIVALSGIATAVVLYPVVKKQNESLAIGLVATRVLEAATMFLGVAFLITAISLQHEGEALHETGHALVILYDRIFLLGQGFIPALNDLLLGFLLYKSRLVPRGLSLIGIIGAFPLIAGYFGILFGFTELRSYLSALSAVMVAVFEFSLGIYLIVKGFKTDNR